MNMLLFLRTEIHSCKFKKPVRRYKEDALEQILARESAPAGSSARAAIAEAFDQERREFVRAASEGETPPRPIETQTQNTRKTTPDAVRHPPCSDRSSLFSRLSKLKRTWGGN